MEEYRGFVCGFAAGIPTDRLLPAADRDGDGKPDFGIYL
jgi:hypothetical protein